MPKMRTFRLAAALALPYVVRAAGPTATPIQHLIVIFDENTPRLTCSTVMQQYFETLHWITWPRIVTYHHQLCRLTWWC